MEGFNQIHNKEVIWRHHMKISGIYFLFLLKQLVDQAFKVCHFLPVLAGGIF